MLQMLNAGGVERVDCLRVCVCVRGDEAEASVVIIRKEGGNLWELHY